MAHGVHPDRTAGAASSDPNHTNHSQLGRIRRCDLDCSDGESLIIGPLSEGQRSASGSKWPFSSIWSGDEEKPCWLIASRIAAPVAQPDRASAFEQQ